MKECLLKQRDGETSSEVSPGKVDFSQHQCLQMVVKWKDCCEKAKYEASLKEGGGAGVEQQ